MSAASLALKQAGKIIMNQSPPRVALVTGGARRIGAEIVRQLHATGINIVLHYRNSSAEAQTLANELQQSRPDSVRLIPGDLLQTAQLPQLFAQMMQCWGRLDIIINNASSFYPTPIGAITEDDWEKLLGPNLKAPLFLAQAAADELKRHHGCIVNIADIHGERPLKNYPVYSIAKAGLVMLTKALARELAPAVRVNAVAPGAILWPEDPEHGAQHQDIINRTALKCEGEPADIARTVVFLVNQAPYITGQVITVDGGRSLSN
jgi:pteridine reductase